MTDKLVFKLEFPDETGKKVPVELPVAAARELIVNLIGVAASQPQPDTLEVDIPLDPNPVRATAFAISEIEGDPHSARVSIGAGEIDLQFSVPLEALMEALESLKEITEPDPSSSRRPN